MMIDNLKNYLENELDFYQNTATTEDEKSCCRHRAFGAVDFVCNYYDEFFNDAEQMWTNEYREKFGF